MRAVTRERERDFLVWKHFYYKRERERNFFVWKHFYRDATTLVGDSTVIDVARRQTLQLARPSDTVLLSNLRDCAEELCTGDKKMASIPQMLRGFAKACGMKCELVMKQERQPDGKRPRLLESASFERILPEIIDIWQVWSSRLQSHVRVADWQQAHETLEEEIQEAYDALDPAHFADSGSSAGGEQRKEKIDGLAHWKQLQRLRAKRNPTKQDARWLNWLETADLEAQPPRRDGETPPHVRTITVTYHKRRAIGRRTASYPSMQNCPSGLRPQLVKRFYHDIGNGKSSTLAISAPISTW